MHHKKLKIRRSHYGSHSSQVALLCYPFCSIFTKQEPCNQKYKAVEMEELLSSEYYCSKLDSSDACLQEGSQDTNLVVLMFLYVWELRCLFNSTFDCCDVLLLILFGCFQDAMIRKHISSRGT